MLVHSKHYYVAQQTGLIPVINSAMAKTSSSNHTMAETVHRSKRTKTAEQGGGGVVEVPPGSTTTNRTERQRVD